MAVKIIFILILAALSVYPQEQQLKVVTGSGNKYIPVYERQGTVYIPVTDFADAVKAGYTADKTTGKTEIKFSKGTLKVTPKNPFLVVIDINLGMKTYQLPTSTYSLNGKIYIPLLFSIEILNEVSGLSFKYSDKFTLTVKDAAPAAAVKKTEDKKAEEVKISKFDINGISIDERANGTMIRVRSSKRIPSYSTLFRDGFLYVMLRNVTADTSKFSLRGGSGLVRDIYAQNIENSTEIKFKLNKEYSSSEVINAEGGNDVIITIHNKLFSRDNSAVKNKEKWNFDVIVLDAGHGGKDAGAIGVNGAKEKDINLAVALKVGELIKKEMKDVKVVYTRSDDRFVELYKRGKIANDNGGKLFISIHCNSTPKKNSGANGFEVYLLRPGRTKEAIAIAERENSVIQYEDNPARYQQLTDENFILVSMAHSSYMKYSEKFSDLLNSHMGKKMPLPSRGVKQAGFYVLVGASMPSVLIETGFLSNKKDADYLKSKKGQTQMAEAIYEAVKSFKGYYEEVLEAEI